MAKVKDLTGLTFYRLTVLSFIEVRNTNAYFLCECICKTRKEVSGQSLKRGSVRSCGCLSKELLVKDLTGKRFGKLLVKSINGRQGKPNHTFTMFLCICDCGKEVTVSSSNLQKGNTQSCGCIFADKMQGASHPQWKGGVTTEARKIRTSVKYAEWRKSVFEKDNYTCQKCSKRGNTLNAHHKKSFAENPELRLSVQNGVTFCKVCHHNFHKKYGYKNNNEQQVADFLT